MTASRRRYVAICAAALLTNPQQPTGMASTRLCNGEPERNAVGTECAPQRCMMFSDSMCVCVVRVLVRGTRACVLERDES